MGVDSLVEARRLTPQDALALVPALSSSPFSHWFRSPDAVPIHVAAIEVASPDFHGYRVGYVLGKTADGSAIYLSADLQQKRQGTWCTDRGHLIPIDEIVSYVVIPPHQPEHRRSGIGNSS